MNNDHEFSEGEFEDHMKSVFEEEHFEDGKFIFCKSSFIHGLNVLSYDCVDIEVHLKEKAPYFTGKFTIIETLRKMQAVSGMLAIALEKINTLKG